MDEVNAMLANGRADDMTAVPTSYGRFCRDWRMRVKERVVHPLAVELWPDMLAGDS